MSNDSYNILITKLDQFIRRYYKNQLIKGVLYTVGLLLSAFLVTVVIEYFGEFETAIRTVLFYGWLTVSAVTLFRLIILPISRLYKIGQIISHKQAAAIIGKHFSEVQDKLLNVLQLKEQSVGASSDLLLASITQKSNELSPVPFSAVIDFSQNRKYIKLAAFPVLIFLLMLFAAPNIIRQTTNRLVNHSEHFDAVAPFSFFIENKELKAVKQEDYELGVAIDGNILPNEAFIEIDGSRFRLIKESGTHFKHTFKNIQHKTEFKLFADGFYSQLHTLEVLPKPLLLSFKVQLDYPKYTGKKDEIIRNTGDFQVPEGTKATWSFFTKDAENISLNFPDSLVILDPTGVEEYKYSRRFRKSSAYYVAAQNNFMRSKDSVYYAINVIPDQFPFIEVEERADSLSAKRIYFRGNIKDDYGLSKLTFNYRFINNSDTITGAGPAASDILINKTVQDNFFHYWDISELTVAAGDQIEYYFEVWDNDGINGSKSARTKKMVFKAPTKEELSDKADKTNEEIKEKMESSLKDAKEIQKDLEKLRKKLMEKKELSWEDKKQLEELLEKQKQLEKNIENVKNENQQKINEQNEYNKQDERIIEKQKQIQELFDQVMSDEMKEMYKQLEEMMEKLNKEELQQKIEEMKLSNKDIEKELDRTLELFKQMEFEQKLEETIEKLDELAKEQEKLSEQTKDKEQTTEELKQKQEDLNKKFDELKKEMEDLEKKNDDLEFSNTMPDTKEEQKETTEEMKKSSEQLNDNKNKKAAESQKNASEKMKEMSQKLQKMQEQMQEEAQSEDINNLRQLLENLIQLSFDQEDLLDALTGLDNKDPKYFKVGQQQMKLSDDAKMIEDSLFALSKRIPQLEATVNREISDINANMERALQFIQERQTPQAKARQQYIMTAVNNLALLLDEVVQQMQQQQSEKKFGQQSCSKPGSNSQPTPGQMKKMQQQMSEQIEKLKKEMEGEKPGEKNSGGKGGGQQMSKKLAQLAAEQGALREEIQKLADKMKEDGSGGGKGNMDKLAELMEENEKDLVNKRITQETINRQREILTRLLEHEKADREREFDDKRQSQEAKNQNFSNPSDFFEYKRLKEKEAELLRTIPPAMNSFYKHKVNEYFNHIE